MSAASPPTLPIWWPDMTGSAVWVRCFFLAACLRTTLRCSNALAACTPFHTMIYQVPCRFSAGSWRLPTSARSPRRGACYRGHLCASRYSQHPRVRRVRTVLRAQHHLPWRTAAIARTPRRRCRLAPALARSSRPHEPEQRPGGSHRDRHRHGARFRVG